MGVSNTSHATPDNAGARLRETRTAEVRHAGPSGNYWYAVEFANALRPGQVIGVVLGVPAAIAGTRLLRSQLFGIQGFDPTSVAAAVGVLLLSALIAGAVPAIRAGRVSPLESLRAE